MRNHEDLIAMRKTGRKPGAVWLHTDCDVPEGAHWFDFTPGIAHIHVEATDVLDRLDLRFLVGCRVWVAGDAERRVRDVFAKAQDAGAERVIGYVAAPVGTSETCSLILDTEGVLTWPKEMAHA